MEKELSINSNREKLGSVGQNIFKQTAASALADRIGGTERTWRIWRSGRAPRRSSRRRALVCVRVRERAGGAARSPSLRQLPPQAHMWQWPSPVGRRGWASRPTRLSLLLAHSRHLRWARAPVVRPFGAEWSPYRTRNTYSTISRSLNYDLRYSMCHFGESKSNPTPVLEWYDRAVRVTHVIIQVRAHSTRVLE